jgi:hypothetical protein
MVPTHNSVTALAVPMRWVHMPQLRFLILRRTMPQLRHLIGKSYELYKSIDPTAHYDRQSNTWKFSSGAEGWFGYLESEADQWRYHGQEFQIAIWDELTEQATLNSYKWMWSRLRSEVGPDGSEIIPCFQRATSNPGGPGHLAVKEYFIDPCETGNVIIQTSEQEMEDGTVLPPMTRTYIPATVFDNPSINAKKYIARMMHLPKWRRDALIYGRWDSYEGAAFALAPDMILAGFDWYPPASMYRWRSCDWGYSTAGCVLWHAIDYDGVIYTYRELYFTHEDPARVAERIRKLEDDAGECIKYGFLDPQCWEDGAAGPVVEAFWRNGVNWVQADRSRFDGFTELNARVHRRRKVVMDGVESEQPWWFIHERCKYLIKTMRAIPADPNAEDVDKKFKEDHAYDCARYGLLHQPLGRPGYRPHGTMSSTDRFQRMWRGRDRITGM